MRSPETGDFWLVGRIGKPVGLAGECLLHPASADPSDVDRIAEAPVRIVPDSQDPSRHPPQRIASLRRHGKRTIFSFEGFNSRNAVEEIAHHQLWVRREDLAPLEEPDTWWIDDLVGCTLIQVATADGTEQTLGEVMAVAEGVVHDFLSIQLASGKRAEVPFLKAFLREVNVEARLIRVDLPEGLIES